MFRASVFFTPRSLGGYYLLDWLGRDVRGLLSFWLTGPRWQFLHYSPTHPIVIHKSITSFTKSTAFVGYLQELMPILQDASDHKVWICQTSTCPLPFCAIVVIVVFLRRLVSPPSDSDLPSTTKISSEENTAPVVTVSEWNVFLVWLHRRETADREFVCSR